VEAIFQFFVLFSGPLGVLGLLAVVFVLWTVRSWRRERPRLRVVPGGAEPPARPSADPSARPSPGARPGPGPGGR
jgi:hypothetical protein